MVNRVRHVFWYLFIGIGLATVVKTAWVNPGLLAYYAFVGIGAGAALAVIVRFGARWPGIRHLRWVYYRLQLNRHADFWGQYGYYVQARDEQELQKIWDGYR